MGAGTRSGLAFSFLALAERHRPRFVLLENVPGLLSSHGGRDMAALIGALVELGYGVGYRILDARYFGVPQRRRRVFILGDSLGGRAGAERASEVLSVGSRCRWHPPTGIEAGTDVAARTRPGVDFSISPALTRSIGTSGGHNGIDDAIIAASYGSGDGRPTRALTVSGGNDEEAGYGPLVVPTLTNPDRLRWDATYPISAGPTHDARGQGRRRQGSADLGGYEPHDGYEPDSDAIRRAERPQADSDRMRATHELAGRAHNRDGLEDLETYVTGTLREHVRPGSNTDQSILTRGGVTDDPLLPLGLDSHRYRCCGNGVVSDVSEWIGHRLAAIVAS